MSLNLSPLGIISLSKRVISTSREVIKASKTHSDFFWLRHCGFEIRRGRRGNEKTNFVYKALRTSSLPTNGLKVLHLYLTLFFLISAAKCSAENSPVVSTLNEKVKRIEDIGFLNQQTLKIDKPEAIRVKRVQSNYDVIPQVCLCKVSRDNKKILCLKLRSINQLCVNSQNAKKVVELHIANFTQVAKLHLTKEILQYRLKVKPHQLRRLRITNNEFDEVKFCQIDFNSNSNSNYFSCQAFSKLTHLDLRGNLLESPAQDEFHIESLSKIWLSGNYWSCREESEITLSDKNGWILEKKHLVQDEEETLCIKRSLFKWHQNVTNTSKYSNVTLFHYLEFHNDMSQKCPSRCQCQVLYLTIPLWANVSCVNSSLDSLPPQLPHHTQILDVSYNRITHLDELAENDDYKHLKKLFANNNKILTLYGLKGSPFLNSNEPTTLNLQHNQLTEFDVELLEPTLSSIKKVHTHESVRFLFAGNPWDCGCNSLQSVQTFIYEYKILLGDADFFACGKQRHPYLIKINYEATCQPKGIDFMAFIVVIEVILLVLVLSNLSYDYYHYSRTGELPWLARQVCIGYGYGGLFKTGQGCPSWGKCTTSITSYCQRRHSNDTLPPISLDGSLRSPNGGKRLQFLDAFRPRRNTETSRSMSNICGYNSPLHQISNVNSSHVFGDEDHISLREDEIRHF